jgi:hypothetical protein
MSEPKPEPASQTAAQTSHASPISLRQFLALAVLIVVAAVSGTYVVATWLAVRSNPVRPFTEMKGQWIQAASNREAYSSAFRRDFRLAGHVRNAWIAVSARDGFEVTVNGYAIGWQYMMRPTRPYQSTLSERGQWISWPKVALSLNFAREYQWTDHDNYLLPVFVDLTPYLKPGSNIIGLEIESRESPAKVRFDGSIKLWNGEVISLASGSDWQAEVTPPNIHNMDWRSPNYPIRSWQSAVLSDPPPDQPLRTFDPRIYSTDFRGRWIRHPAASAQDSIWFQTEWNLQHTPDEAWIRLATNRNYELFINGRRGFPDTPDSRGLEAGEWIFGHQRAADPLLFPEQMFSHEVGDEFVGRSFTAPRKEPLGVDQYRFKSIAKPTPPNLGDNAWTLIPQKPRTRNQALEPPEPLMMRHDRAVGAFAAYNLGPLLHTGKNTIAIRLNRPAAADPANWPGQIAVDGEASYRDGSRDFLLSGRSWEARTVGSSSTDPETVSVVERASARLAGNPLTKLQYRGTPWPLEFLPHWSRVAAATSGGGLAAFAGLLAFAGLWPRRQEPAGSSTLRLADPALVCRILFDALLPFATVLVAVILVQTTFGERSEALWFFTPQVWQWSILLAVTLGALAVGVRIVRLMGMSQLRRLSARAWRWLAELPGTRLWILLLVGMSLLTFFLRAFRLDYQPQDYDEYPSLQAILSVARSGIPSYVPDAVWYTRSPLYHYITGAVVWLFGENLWAFRLPSALFSVATGLLLYFCGSRLLNRPWVGMLAFALTVIHPMMVMTGHMIRFYQQQQFFALLMAYWFCKGFVTEQSQRHRYLTVAAFLAAALSQEITAVVAVPLGIGYLFFAAKKSISENVKLLIVVACAMAIIAVDFALYETRTLTRLEGYSTTMQADVGPHLWEPYNFLTVFLSYSRIHLPLAAMLFFGLPAVLRYRNRTVLALHLIFFGGIIMLNLMVTQVSARYVYWLFPLLLLLGIDNARAGLAWLDAAIHRRRSWPSTSTHLRQPARSQDRPEPDVSRLSFASQASLGVLFAAVVISWSPWRLPDTFRTKLLGDSDGALEYVRQQLRPGDLLAITQPNAKAALMNVGKVDYEIHIPMVYDFVLRQNGRLIERAAGARVIYTVEQLQRVCSEHPRLWLVIDREKFPFPGQRIKFDHTGARLELFLRKNTQLVQRSYLWNVYLWDADHGLYHSFRSTE